MATGGHDRWVEVSPSQFTHETEGLNLVKALLPDESPFRAWSNFEFRDSRGRWHEVDLLVLGRSRLHLVELKYYSGRLTGDDHTWLRPGKRAEDSPLKLARRKAQYLASKLTDALYDWGKEQGTKITDSKLIVPFIQESVFLHHPDIVCDLPPSSAIGLYGIDDLTDRTHLPGISERLLEEPHKQAIGPNQEEILAALMKRIGLVQRRERTAGSWTITAQPLAAGEGWQEWLAHHKVAQQQRARIRFHVVPEGAPQSETVKVARTLEHEYQLMGRLQHDGIMRPKDLVQSELGTGLVYDYDESWQRLDLWMADQPHGVSLTTQLSIIRQIGEALQYAHANKVVHRELSPRCIWVKDIAGTGEVKIRVGGWAGAGMADPASLTHTTLQGVTTLKGAEQAALAAQPDSSSESRWTEAFQAPEGAWSQAADRVRIDVFGLGALSFYVIAQRAAAGTPAELNTRLAAQQGLDLSVELPQVPSELRSLVLGATQPAPTKRTGDIHTFLTLLDKAEQAALRPEESATDPLEATPGAPLSDRFTLRRRLGQGSTAVGLLVTDHDAPANAPDRVLKVALHDDAAKRLHAEADTLRALNNPRIVKLVEGPITVGGREALLLESAGEQTLGNELLSRTRLSLDLLERYGTELLDAVVALDKAGVDHRDIKPSNLGIREGRGDRTKHLVLFDFSLSGAAASATSAGTPPYLDPFLTGKRAHFDSAAERYAAAVVLFEMATGQTPTYGDDPNAKPDTIPDDATIRHDMFDPAIADLLVAFFTTALARSAKARHQTAEEMRQAWRAIFTTDATTAPDETADAQAAAATLDTPLPESGLTARALSALEPERIATVGELLAIDPVRISRLRGVANSTRLQITRRMKEWRKRLGDVAAPKSPADRAAADDTIEAAAERLLQAATGTGVTSHAQMTRVLLGYGTTVDALATQAALAAHLPDPVSPARAGQILAELQSTWASDQTTRAILERLVTIFMGALADHGNVLTAAEASTAIERSFRGDADDPRPDHRLASGLLRIAMERVRELRRIDEDALPATFIRRRDRYILIAHDQSLLDLAEDAGRAADDLIARAAEPVQAFVPAARVNERLRPILDSATLTEIPDALNGATPLAHLAAAVSENAAATAAGDLHHRDLSPTVALRLSFGEVTKDQALSPDEIRRRVQVRFPGLAPLPQRPRLDALIREAGLDLLYDDARRVFRSPTHTGDTTGLESRHSTIDVRSLPITSQSDLGRRVEESLRTRSFLALGVPASRLDRFQQGVASRYAAHLVDITGVLLDALRSQAARSGVPWDMVLAADAEVPTSRAAQGLGALVKQAWPGVTAAVEDALAAEGDGPVVLADAAPLARYDNMALLARWTDLGTARARAVWLVVPQLGANRGSVLDGQPVPLAAPTQFVTVDPEWVDGLTAAAVQ
ncbi:protein kinase [Intrasporangium chromatireducens Q5-1]|uniref:Protein kinase n=1 Tax=Intrasporangium chromatireducens Q5-1 TaxID=584657 RepID=W9GPB2_9MICO|nr:BREX system serine/threonine kinase PglW [Intrasporangium chromatireducens]EWT07980.1 protein kinase [Intrasporangium chromatireducens Q5-1]